MNMLAAAVVLSAARPAGIDLAYEARYYFQGSKPSYHQIYLVRHDGANKVQVTHNTYDSYAPMWLDRNTLAYVEAYQQVKKSDFEHYWFRCRIKKYDLRTARTTKLRDLGVQDLYFGSPSVRGNTLTFDSHGEGFATSKSFRLTADGKAKPTQSPGLQLWFGNDGKSGRMHITLSSKSAQATFRWYNDDNDNGVNLEAESNGLKKVIKLDGGEVVNGFTDVDGSYLFVIRPWWIKYDSEHVVYRIAPDLSKSTVILRDVGFLTIGPASPLWSAPQKDTGKYFLTKLKDGRGVESNWLYTGNYRTGQRWTIATGNVNVGVTAFRPAN